MWEDNGEDLTEDVIDQLILANSGITCIGFMGGDQAPQKVVKLSQYVKSKYPTLHTGWYSGKESFPLYHGTFDYIKLGPWKEECGPLNDPKTNQRMYMNIGGSELNASFADITERAFWAPKPWDADYFESSFVFTIYYYSCGQCFISFSGNCTAYYCSMRVSSAKRDARYLNFIFWL